MPDSIRLAAGRPEPPIQILLDGQPVACYRGETLAGALLACGVHRFRSARDGSPRQPFCNMGTCFDCTVTVDGVPMVRACLTPAQPGMNITTSG
jgi:D-hydroxyproline dehydrogenase subunit gamma